MEFEKLLIVIPTRNRSDLAINAINSVLTQSNCNFEVIVSDNSTEENEVFIVMDYCQKAGDERLHYIRPPKPLSMTEHWNWAMEQALQIPSISHITFLTDRMLFLDNSLAEVQNILIKVESKVLSFCTDLVRDNKIPVVLWQMKWSGKVYEVDSTRLTKHYSEIEVIYHPLPRMLNCAVSVSLINKIYSKFGNYFSSVAPDFNFAFRVLDMLDSVYFYDKPLLIQYGVSRSNGMNFVKGIHNKESKDFVKNLAVKNVNFNTSVDDIRIMPNVIMHEYYEVEQVSQSEKFPSINRENYLISLVENVFNYNDLEVRKEMIEKLDAELGKYELYKYRLKHRIIRYKHAIKIRLHNISNRSHPFIIFKEFETVEQAIGYANKFLRTPHNTLDLSKENLGENGSGVKIILEYVEASQPKLPNNVS